MIHHRRGLRHQWNNRKVSTSDQDKFLEQLERDPALIETSESDRVMLNYCVKLTVKPASISKGDVERLSESGFDSLAIHDICAITAYFAFVNRIADGLGVEIESA